MAASDRVPPNAIVELGGVEYVRLGGDEWSPNLIARVAFDARFADIADASDFLAALAAHPAAQTPGWQAGVEWIRQQAAT